jgi:hypothetical protein
MRMLVRLIDPVTRRCTNQIQTFTVTRGIQP